MVLKIQNLRFFIVSKTCFYLHKMNVYPKWSNKLIKFPNFIKFSLYESDNSTIMPKSNQKKRQRDDYIPQEKRTKIDPYQIVEERKKMNVFHYHFSHTCTLIVIFHFFESSTTKNKWIRLSSVN